MSLGRSRRNGAAALLLLCACSDDPSQPPIAVVPDTIKPGILEAAISEPSSLIAAGIVNANAAGGTVYVAFPAGELGNARSVRLRNVGAGGGAGTDHLVVAGGLDPVAIIAEVGDTLELIVSDVDGSTVSMRAAVPRKRAPRIIRVDPPRGRTDVALNTKILVVFSEPIDPSSVTGGTLRLSVAGQSVPGRFEFADGPGVTVQFVAATLLAPNNDYTITIGQGIIDLAGDALAQTSTSSFTTASAGSASNYANARVTVTTTGVDIPTGYLATLFGGSTQPIPSNGSVTFTNVPLTASMPGLTHFVVLSGLAAHCSVISANPKALPAVLLAGETVDIGFTVSCDKGGQTGIATIQKIAFVRGNDIFAVEADGTNEVRLTESGRNEGPAWSPEGGRLAFASDRAGYWDVYTVNADGSGLVRRTSSNAPYGHASRPVWSPDGGKLAFHAYCDGDSCIRVTTLGDAAPPIRLGQPRGYNTDPAWSPDGKSLAFVSDWAAFDFVFDIYVTNMDGSSIVQLTNGFGSLPSLRYYLHPVWSPDGSKIALVYGSIINTSDMRYKVAVMNADGTGLRDLAFAGDIPWVQLQDPGSIAWSPDGTRIAFTRVDCDLTTQRQCSTLRSIHSVAIDGSGESLVVANAHSPSWRR